MARLADRLSAARQRLFVGREAARALFESALVAPEFPFFVLHVFGPGGIGKTTLLGEFMRLCDQTKIPAIYLDARNTEPLPDAFLAALRFSMRLAPDDSPTEVLAGRPSRHVVLIDTYEAIASLDGWLREVFLPELPADILVVIADLHPLSPSWRADPGWQDLIRSLSLRNLSPKESREYLLLRRVPEDQLEPVLDFTHGHPLALSLVADLFDQRPGFHFEPEAAPDMLKTLLERFLQRVPGPAHRLALEVCALARVTTEPLLASVMAIPDAHELFEWLRDLSFIEYRRGGLFPHDLAREALVADLRWRNPVWYTELHKRARTYYYQRIQETRGPEQQGALFDLIFLHRDNPVVRPFFEWQASGRALSDPLRHADVPDLVAMVTQHEGAESARLAAHWLASQPEGVAVFRDAEGRPEGFLAMVALQRATQSDLELDPAVTAASKFLQRQAPLRPGEVAIYFRFWLARDTYQDISSTQTLIFINMVRQYLVTSDLAYTFIPTATPDFWTAVFAYGDLARLPEADFEVGGRRYGLYGHDWRAVSPLKWLELLADREIAMGTPAPAAVPAERLIVLSESEFADAVGDALRDRARPDVLRGNPLIRSRVVEDRAGAATSDAERVSALRDLLKQAAEQLRESPKETKYYRAVFHTYLQPAATQEQAAELLDLPFSTYRRHLKSGATRIAEILWQAEVNGLER